MNNIETILESSNLTIKHEGKNVRVPPTVLSLAKDHALNVIGLMDVLSFKKKNPNKKFTDAQQRDFKEAFEGYLSGWYESMYPQENPRNRAKAAVQGFDLLGENSKFFTQANFPNLNLDQLKQKQNAFKSGVFNLNDAFLEGVMGTIRQRDMPFTAGMKGDETKKQKMNRYYQLMSVTWILAFAEKMFELNKNDVKAILDKQLLLIADSKNNEKQLSQAFVAEIKSKMHSELSRINLLNTLK